MIINWFVTIPLENLNFTAETGRPENVETDDDESSLNSD